VPAPRAPLFLERQTYRRRRLMDAARILPVAGLVCLLVPVLWSRNGQTSTASEAIYIFGLWLVLILSAVFLSRPLKAAIERETAPYPPPLPQGDDGVPEAASPSSPVSPATQLSANAPDPDPDPTGRAAPVAPDR